MTPKSLPALLLASALALLVWLAPGSACAQSPEEFALRDGDTVVFLGDSITAALTYGKVIENYTLLRFPERKVRFYNAGKGGDTAEGSLKRLETEVFARKATVLLVAFGINDIGWGMRATEESKQRYLKAIRSIIEQCKARAIRVYICSAPVTGADPDKSENDFLQKMCDEGMALSRSLGQSSIDVQRTMRAVQRKVKHVADETTNPKDKPTLHAADTIHLNDTGQILMAYAILKGLGAPAEVSSATLDARSAACASCQGCSVSVERTSPTEIAFTRRDQRLPLNLGLIGILSYRFVPIPDELNQYMLAVENLEPGLYEITVDQRKVGAFASQRLAEGVNLGSATPDPWEPGGPWDAQASSLRPLTDARNDLVVSARLAAWQMPENPNRAQMAEQAARLNEQTEELQRLTARPVDYHYVVRRIDAPKPR